MNGKNVKLESVLSLSPVFFFAQKNYAVKACIQVSQVYHLSGDRVTVATNSRDYYFLEKTFIIISKR